MNIYDEAKYWFSYNPETGEIARLPMPRSLFCSDRAYHRHLYYTKVDPVKTSANGYKYVSWNYKQRQYKLSVHRLAWACHHGEVPPDMQIDHQDGNPSNNVLSNLRMVDHGGNMRNRKLCKRNKTGVHGVRFESSRGKYVVNLRGKTIGRCRDFFEAVCLRRSAEISSKVKFHENHGRR